MKYIPFDHFFLVRLPNINYYLFDVNDNKEQNLNRNEIELTEQKQIIVDYIKQYGSIRRTTVEDILGIMERRANIILKELVSKNILRVENN